MDEGDSTNCTNGTMPPLDYIWNKITHGLYLLE